MAKDVKLLRKQINNVLKDNLKELLCEALVAEMHTRLRAEILADMTKLNKRVDDVLSAVDERSKETQSHIIRSLQTNARK